MIAKAMGPEYCRGYRDMPRMLPLQSIKWAARGSSKLRSRQSTARGHAASPTLSDDKYHRVARNHSDEREDPKDGNEAKGSARNQ